MLLQSNLLHCKGSNENEFKAQRVQDHGVVMQVFSVKCGLGILRLHAKKITLNC